MCGDNWQGNWYLFLNIDDDRCKERAMFILWEKRFGLIMDIISQKFLFVSISILVTYFFLYGYELYFSI